MKLKVFSFLCKFFLCLKHYLLTMICLIMLMARLCAPPMKTTVLSTSTELVGLDKLLPSALLASTSPTITPASKTSHEAWKKLNLLYASRSRTRAMQLEELTLIQRGSRIISEDMHVVKMLVDELAIIDSPISNDDLTLYVLNGLGSDFRGITALICARESSLTFKELHNLLVGHETYLRRLEDTSKQQVITANYSNRLRNNGTRSQFVKKPNKYNGTNRIQGGNLNSFLSQPSQDNHRNQNGFGMSN